MSFDQLSLDNSIDILFHLSLKDISQFCQVNKKCLEISDSQKLWKRIYEREKGKDLLLLFNCGNEQKKEIKNYKNEILFPLHILHEVKKQKTFKRACFIKGKNQIWLKSFKKEMEMDEDGDYTGKIETLDINVPSITKSLHRSLLYEFPTITFSFFIAKRETYDHLFLEYEF